MRFERVLSCKCRQIDPARKDAVLNLLAVEFSETEAPSGMVTLTFSGGATMRFDVECLEAELADLAHPGQPLPVPPTHISTSPRNPAGADLIPARFGGPFAFRRCVRVDAKARITH